MDLLINYLFKSLLLPPGLFLMLLAIGWILLWFRPFLAKLLLGLVLVLGYLLSTSWISHALIDQLQTMPALTADQVKRSGAGAIVVLSAGRYKDAPEYGGDTVEESTLIRLRYGAYLHRITGLPILVTGGYGFDTSGDSLAQVMAAALKNDYGITDVWLEGESRTTGENAMFSKKVLDEKGVKRVLLVTHAWHMPRSVAIFKQAGLDVVPAPTMFLLEHDSGVLQFFPNPGALTTSYYAMHELVGRAWYAIRY
ncbi:MAG: YdcF family protein [Gammaproteobacteria bacterium]|nr:YdcF family protein [Gammaproteobacteria bacterium]